MSIEFTFGEGKERKREQRRKQKKEKNLPVFKGEKKRHKREKIRFIVGEEK